MIARAYCRVICMAIDKRETLSLRSGWCLSKAALQHQANILQLHCYLASPYNLIWSGDRLQAEG